MLKLFKNSEIYSPEKTGKKDILFCDGKIIAVENEITINTNIEIDIKEYRDKLIMPGFTDCHVHITGGGGEGSFSTRTPELDFRDLIKGGISTVVGTLGTDGITRSMENLIAKAKAINEEGATCYIYTGSYHVPVKTVTGNIASDIMLFSEIIGVGEIAISDHRSSQPTIEELKKIASDARLGGILSGKSGIVNLHVGDGERQLSFIEEIIKNTEIPPTQFLPTHMGRNYRLFENAMKYIKSGGYADFTTSRNDKSEGLSASEALFIMLRNNMDLNHITFSSDGQGSLPVFDENGIFSGLSVGKVTSLYGEIKKLVKNENIPLEKILKVITVNPANILKLKNKGRIKKGYDADFVIADRETLDITDVYFKGKQMMENSVIIHMGKFEE
ncbi:MAG: beta-aspartyl-peptidase [Thermotogae bacterium]|nr:beta-aspartyl-peptidase [Thermotogota bacterium]MCP5465508.1 beta-aspartyl-peptidase [Thermotogota bacterium]HOO74010.1 beta-aspartyl-peptidase [Tepiditoga sp.]